MAKNKLASLLQQEFDKGFSAGIRVGLQFNNDLYHMALNDSDVVGKDIFGSGRLENIHHAVEDLSNRFADALDASRPEADVFRDKIDKRLQKALKDKFQPWEIRYPELKAVKYK